MVRDHNVWSNRETRRDFQTISTWTVSGSFRLDYDHVGRVGRTFRRQSTKTSRNGLVRIGSIWPITLVTGFCTSRRFLDNRQENLPEWLSDDLVQSQPVTIEGSVGSAFDAGKGKPLNRVWRGGIGCRPAAKSTPNFSGRFLLSVVFKTNPNERRKARLGMHRTATVADGAYDSKRDNLPERSRGKKPSPGYYLADPQELDDRDRKPPEEVKISLHF